jgi:four helix bundle protein
VFAHEKLQAWQLCHQLLLAVYEATGLTSQARRAAFSSAVNIVEGSAKRGPREFRRFLDISLGSLAELSYTLRVARDLKLIDDSEWKVLDRLRRQAGMMTWKLHAAVASAAKRA